LTRSVPLIRPRILLPVRGESQAEYHKQFLILGGIRPG
jgi:hypothetical protein